MKEVNPLFEILKQSLEEGSRPSSEDFVGEERPEGNESSKGAVVAPRLVVPAQR